MAGYNPTANQLISEEYRLKQDPEGAVERPLAEKPSVRLGSVVALVGIVIASGSILWFGFLQPKPPAKQAVKTTNPSPTSEPVLDESAELKSRLAFQDQRQQLKVEPFPTKSPSQTPQAQLKPNSSAPVRTVRQIVSPPSTTVRMAETAPVRQYSSPFSCKLYSPTNKTTTSTTA